MLNEFYYISSQQYQFIRAMFLQLFMLPASGRIVFYLTMYLFVFTSHNKSRMDTL